MTRRRVYELLHNDAAIAQIAFRGNLRATVTTANARFDLEATEGVRKRVVKSDGHDSTIARPSSLGGYAIDLSAMTLYWHSQPGPAGTYGWLSSNGAIVMRYSRGSGGDFVVEADEYAVSSADRELALLVGSYLLTRMWIAIAPHSAQPHLRASP